MTLTLELQMTLNLTYVKSGIMLSYLTWSSHILILGIYSIYDKYLLTRYYVTDFILNRNQGHRDLPVKWKTHLAISCNALQLSTTMRAGTVF